MKQKSPEVVAKRKQNLKIAFMVIGAIGVVLGLLFYISLSLNIFTESYRYNLTIIEITKYGFLNFFNYTDQVNHQQSPFNPAQSFLITTIIFLSISMIFAILRFIFKKKWLYIVSLFFSVATMFCSLVFMLNIVNITSSMTFKGIESSRIMIIGVGTWLGFSFSMATGLMFLTQSILGLVSVRKPVVRVKTVVNENNEVIELVRPGPYQRTKRNILSLVFNCVAMLFALGGILSIFSEFLYEVYINNGMRIETSFFISGFMSYSPVNGNNNGESPFHASQVVLIMSIIFLSILLISGIVRLIVKAKWQKWLTIAFSGLLTVVSILLVVFINNDANVTSFSDGVNSVSLQVMSAPYLIMAFALLTVALQITSCVLNSLKWTQKVEVVKKPKKVKVKKTAPQTATEVFKSVPIIVLKCLIPVFCLVTLICVNCRFFVERIYGQEPIINYYNFHGYFSYTANSTIGFNSNPMVPSQQFIVNVFVFFILTSIFIILSLIFKKKWVRWPCIVLGSLLVAITLAFAISFFININSLNTTFNGINVSSQVLEGPYIMIFLALAGGIIAITTSIIELVKAKKAALFENKFSSKDNYGMKKTSRRRKSLY